MNDSPKNPSTLPDGVTVDRVRIDGTRAKICAHTKRDGTTRWCVLRLGYRLLKDGGWVYEPLPSSRTVAYSERNSFSTVHAALAAFRQHEDKS